MLQIIEVKSKSIQKDETMEGSKVDIKAGWLAYVEDVAFQKHIVSNAFPQYEVAASLLLVDKDSICPSDGLNQKFKISKGQTGRKKVELRGEITEEDLSAKILTEKNMDELCQVIYERSYSYEGKERSFSNLISLLSNNYKNDIVSSPYISKGCKTCEFKASQEEMDKGLKSGFHECFKLVCDFKEEDFEEDSILDLWDNRKTDKFIKAGKLKLNDLTKEDIGYKTDNKPGLTRTERQWLQIERSINEDESYYIDKANLKKEMDSWTYPLHFIDFETAQPAIPFQKGKKPYEGIAFQFSHHIVYEDGRIEHKNEYLNTEIGVDPNYDFVRKLKDALANDQGTIFKYSDHENTYLNKIYRQLQEDHADIPDRKELSTFIREITKYKEKGETIEGPRNMVDMLKLVQKFYYDPYQLLPKLFSDMGQEDYDAINFEDGESYGDEINDGGAAMTAYYRLQFEDIPKEIRSEIERALLKYCELDTLAMVMIYEAWSDMIK